MSPPVSFADVAPQIDRLGISLLSQMLAFDPLQRCSAADAIKHAYFNSNVLPGPSHDLSLTSELTSVPMPEPV